MIPYEELGLTKNEAKAYDMLVKLGKAPAAKISSQAGVPYSRIYDVLESLIAKGLVKVVPGMTKEFVPTDPQMLLALVVQKKMTLEAAAKEISELKKHYEFAVKEPVLVAQGKGNFYKLVKEMKKTEQYNYAIKYISEPKPDWMLGDKRKIKQGIDMKNLARYDKETKKNVQQWVKETGPRWRTLDNEGVAMAVRDDQEVIIGLIKSNTTLVIRDAPFTKIMKQLFLAQWEKSQAIKKE